MPLQTESLVMTGLGVLGDTPPHELQPPLPDGIHLRWTYRFGFPWHGFYLLRRENHSEDLERVGVELGGLSAGEQPSTTVETTHGNYSSDANIVVTENIPSPGAKGIDLSNRTHVRFDLLPGLQASSIEVQCVFQAPGRITITGLLDEIPVAHADIIEGGQPGGILSEEVKFDQINAITLSPGPAVLTDLRLLLVATGANTGWQAVPGFPYPLTLPITHPDYPCTPGIQEDLEAGRTNAAERILYGDPAQFTSPPALMVNTGRVRVDTGSPLVEGAGTKWDQGVVSASFFVDGDLTAYTISSVINETHLVLSRDYGGSSQSGVSYGIFQDPFSQLHDTLTQLVKGGPQAGAMVNRVLPIPIVTSGTIAVTRNSRIVNGNGVNWGANLVGLTLQVGRANSGTIKLSRSSARVDGTGTSWDNSLIGMSLRVPGELTAFVIRQVDSPTQLTLDQEYWGELAAATTYDILETTSYLIVKVNNTQELVLDRGYVGPDRANQGYAIVSSLGSNGQDSSTPRMARQYPLDLVMLASLYPAIAQEVGLYWVDESAEEEKLYDYLIVAAQEQTIGSTSQEAIDWINLNGFERVDAYIVFNQVKKPAPPLQPPSELREYALPTASSTVGTVHAVGLRWETGATDNPLRLLPERPTFFHLWRAALGNVETPTTPAAADYQPITKDAPLLITESLHPPRPPLSPRPDWPSQRLYYIDRGLSDGWYSYQVSGVDLFGRHSVTSAAGVWRQWAPKPKPTPWYYSSPDTERQVDVNGSLFAVRLLDDTPPPPPAAIEAYALDPEDRYVVEDAAYVAWRNGNPTTIGLRVRWRWTQAEMRQAPDVREFRVYYQPGSFNVLLGHTQNVTIAGSSATEATVEADIPGVTESNRYAGAFLQIGADLFEILGAGAATTWSVKVRIYGFQGGQANVVQGAMTVKAVGTTWDKALIGLNFSVSGDPTHYTILDIDSTGTQLTLDKLFAGQTNSAQTYTITGSTPRANSPCSILIPNRYTVGSVNVRNGSSSVKGTGSNWSSAMVGGTLRVAGHSDSYRIIQVPSPSEVTLDRSYGGTNDASKSYEIEYTHPLLIDYSQPVAWRKRWQVVDYQNNVRETIRPALNAQEEDFSGSGATVSGSSVILDQSYREVLELLAPSAESIFSPHIYLATDQAQPSKIYPITAVASDARTLTVVGAPSLSTSTTNWTIGWPERHYELIVAAPETTAGQPFAPSLVEPVVYAAITVSAADNKQFVPDNAVWNNSDRGGTWGGRTGNEGRTGAPAKVFLVHRKPPDPPGLPVFDSDRVYATAADYHSHSFYTFRWLFIDKVQTHIFRALDESIFNIDWERFNRLTLDPDNDAEHRKLFPPDWESARSRQVAAALNALNSLKASGATKATALETYRKLSDDALRVLAALPGNESAFVQLTILPINSDDPAFADREGPDTPDHTANSSARAYIDTLDGRSSNRYFYRAGSVDKAHNRSTGLSLATPPVYCPDIVPPRAPVITKVLGGDRAIILTWASNREPDLAEYRVYRTDEREQTHDTRLMELVHIEAVPAGDPRARSAEVSWIDRTVEVQRSYYYRLVAVDDVQNESLPTTTAHARAYRATPPLPPAWSTGIWIEEDGKNIVRLTWIPLESVEVLIQRRSERGVMWTTVATWLPLNATTFDDVEVEQSFAHEYRMKGRDSSGWQSELSEILQVPSHA